MVAVLGLGPVGLCAVQAAFAAGARARGGGRHRRRAARVRPGAGRRAGAPHGGRPACGRQGAHRGARRRRDDRRGRPSRRARARLPADAQGGDGLGDRGLRRADPGAHGHRLDQGADAEDRARERDQARRPRAGAARLGCARPDAVGHPPHGTRSGRRGLRGLRPPRSAEDRPQAEPAADELTWEQFEAVDMRVGRVVAVDDFPEARRPAWKLEIDSARRSGSSAPRRRSPTTSAASSRARWSSRSSTFRQSRSARSCPSAW